MSPTSYISGPDGMTGSSEEDQETGRAFFQMIRPSASLDALCSFTEFFQSRREKTDNAHKPRKILEYTIFRQRTARRHFVKSIAAVPLVNLDEVASLYSKSPNHHD